MKIAKLCFSLGTLILLQAMYLAAQPASEPQTFCNPLNLNYRFMVDAVDAREAADPVIVLYKNDYYLFASRSGGYWTSPDLRNWTLVIPQGLDVESYAPAAFVMRDTLFFVTPGSTVYKSADPKSGVWIKGPTIKGYGDPALLYDDDGKLYMAYGVSNVNPISIVELDPFTFAEKGSKIDVLTGHAAVHGWERRGDDNLLDEQPWIEGAWLLKHNNKYYLHYAGPGTEYKTYGDGIYVADSPMGPYEYANYSPYAFKPTGFITGIGHGCTFKDKNGQYWRIGTMTISIQHMFERRLGLEPVAFDADGNIYCNTVLGDYPQFFPGIKENPADDNSAGMMLLSHKKYALASSSAEGHGIEKAFDEDVRTFWSAQSGKPGEWMMVDLGKECSVEAVQVNFGELNTTPALVRGRTNVLYEQYILEKSTDGMTWSMLVDKSNNMVDVPHDYIELEEPVTARYIKLTNKFVPGGGTFAIRDLRVFGNSAQAVFTPVNDFTVDRSTVDGRDAVIRWTPVENADGYIINYGIAPNKLYNNFMVYDADSLVMHCLNHGVEYYFSIKAFDSGTDYYRSVGEYKSFQNGNWTDVNTWAYFDGTNWVNPVSDPPSYTDGPITILGGDTVTVTVNDTVDQFVIAQNGQLVINSGIIFYIKNGIETDLMVEGTLKNYGNILNDTLATITFSGNGLYEHNQDGGTIPLANWGASSTISFDSVVTTIPLNMKQDFFNVFWNSPNQTTLLSLDWNKNTIWGDLIINSTGSGSLQLCNPATDSTAIINIKGNINQTGGIFSSTGTSNGNTQITINLLGNIDVTGGIFSACMGTQGGNGQTFWNLIGNVSLKNATTQNLNPNGAKFVFKKDTEPQLLTISGVTFGSGGFPVEVESGTNLDMGTSQLQGNGNFVMKAGATLSTAHPNGIDGSFNITGTKSIDPAANFLYNGTEAQVTGSSFPDMVNIFTINNSNGVTLSKSLIIDKTLDMFKGSLALGGNVLGYSANASLIYSGTTRQTTNDAEFPSVNGPNKLIVHNSSGIIIHASRFVSKLELGYKILLGSNNLTVDSIINMGLYGYVVTADGGVFSINNVGVSQIYFPLGITSLLPMWITNSGTVDRIGVSVVKDVVASPYGPRVNLKWNISEGTQGGGNYNIKFGWALQNENPEFRNDRENNGKIYYLTDTDTTEAGTGIYTSNYSKAPYTLSRGGIENLGTFVVGIFSDPTGILEPSGNNQNGYSLSQNYPNPFNSTTTISFEIPAKSFVSLKVYNLMGQKVAEMAGKEYTAGYHSVTFEKSDLSKGIYYYTIDVKNFVETKKMILMN